MILFMLLLRKEEVTNSTIYVKNVFMCIHLSLRTWNKTIGQSVMHTLVFLPRKKCSLLGSSALLLSWWRKFAPLCCGPSYSVCNLFRMWNSISAWFSEGRTSATYPVLPHVYLTSVVIYCECWSYMYHCTNTGKLTLLWTKGAGKQCIWQYHDMKRIRLIFMRLSTCSLVRQVVSVIFRCPRHGGCNPWILYLLKEPELVMLHSVIIAQLMLDFTIRKLEYLDINDNIHLKTGTWLGHLQWGPTWIDSTLSLCCDARGCYSIAWHSFVGSVVCVVMFDRMGSWLLQCCSLHCWYLLFCVRCLHLQIDLSVPGTTGFAGHLAIHVNFDNYSW